MPELISALEGDIQHNYGLISIDKFVSAEEKSDSIFYVMMAMNFQ